jgi:hypothetical protein
VRVTFHKFAGREGKKGREGKGREGTGREGKGREGKGRKGAKSIAVEATIYYFCQ